MKKNFSSIFGHFTPWFPTFPFQGVQESHVNCYLGKFRLQPTVYSWLFVLKGWFINVLLGKRWKHSISRSFYTLIFAFRTPLVPDGYQETHDITSGDIYLFNANDCFQYSSLVSTFIKFISRKYPKIPFFFNLPPFLLHYDPLLGWKIMQLTKKGLLKDISNELIGLELEEKGSRPIFRPKRHILLIFYCFQMLKTIENLKPVQNTWAPDN